MIETEDHTIIVGVEKIPDIQTPGVENDGISVISDAERSVVPQIPDAINVINPI